MLNLLLDINLATRDEVKKYVKNFSKSGNNINKCWFLIEALIGLNQT